jgi:hypothetical protein
MSPFDAARYARLLEGLEASEISLKVARESDPSCRWDSEFYRKSILNAKQSIERSSETRRLGEITPYIQHPVEVLREYSESGYRVLLAQEVRSKEVAPFV